MSVQRKLLIPVVRSLTGEHGYYPDTSLYNEAVMQITSANSLKQLRQGAMTLYTTATGRVGTPTP